MDSHLVERRNLFNVLTTGGSYPRPHRIREESLLRKNWQGSDFTSKTPLIFGGQMTSLLNSRNISDNNNNWLPCRNLNMKGRFIYGAIS